MQTFVAPLFQSAKVKLTETPRPVTPFGGVVAFLREALALLPAGMSPRCARADSGFFEESLLAFLEERARSYIVVARLTTQLKRRAALIQTWSVVDEHDAGGASSRPGSRAGRRSAVSSSCASGCGRTRRRWAES